VVKKMDCVENIVVGLGGLNCSLHSAERHNYVYNPDWSHTLGRYSSAAWF
jgi:hypothetical protein